MPGHSSCFDQQFIRTESAIVMMDPIGKRFIRYALICNFILWALIYLLVLVLR